MISYKSAPKFLQAQILLAWVLAFSCFATIYLYDFHQGVIQGGGSVRLAFKVGAVVLFLLALIQVGIFRSEIVTMVFGFHLWALLTTLILLPNWYHTLLDWQWINFHLALPVLLLSYSYTRKYGAPVFVDQILLMSLPIFLVADTTALLTGNSLWENHAFIGFLGNPSSMGYFALVCLALAVAHGKGFYYKVLCVVTALLSQSLMVLLVLLGLSFLRWPVRTTVFSAVSLVSLYFVLDYLSPLIGHLVFKVQQLFTLLTNGGVEAASVGTRLELYSSLYARIVESPISLLVGHPGFRPYITGDAGWLGIIVSYGVPAFCVYFGACIFVIIKIRSMVNAQHLFVILSAFMLMLITNRLHDYWPISIVFYWYLGVGTAMIRKPIAAQYVPPNSAEKKTGAVQPV